MRNDLLVMVISFMFAFALQYMLGLAIVYFANIVFGTTYNIWAGATLVVLLVIASRTTFSVSKQS